MRLFLRACAIFLRGRGSLHLFTHSPETLFISDLAPFCLQDDEESIIQPLKRPWRAVSV